MPTFARISRVILRNYKSIRYCDVPLGTLTFLTGPNGSGKSNFVEALRFLSYALSNSLEQALVKLSGIRAITHWAPGVAMRVAIEVSFEVAGNAGNYRLEIDADDEGSAVAVNDECTVECDSGTQWFKNRSGVVQSNQGVIPAGSADKLYLVNASGLAAFEPVYRALSSIAVYNPVPDEIRGFKAETRYKYLDRSARALAEIVARLRTAKPERFVRVVEYLQRVNPIIRDVEAVPVDGSFGLRFAVDQGAGRRAEFSAHNISDGTLRALAVLVALFQASDRQPLTLVGLEEPEAGLHPAAAAVLFDAIREGSQFAQIVVTSHSPDLLDRDDIPEDWIRAVSMCDGQSIIGKVDSAGRAALKERLYTAGELMRMDQLRPEALPDCTNV